MRPPPLLIGVKPAPSELFCYPSLVAATLRWARDRESLMASLNRAGDLDSVAAAFRGLYVSAELPARNSCAIPGRGISNRPYGRLEINISPTKQTTGALSNRSKSGLFFFASPLPAHSAKIHNFHIGKGIELNDLRPKAARPLRTLADWLPPRRWRAHRPLQLALRAARRRHLAPAP